MHGRDADLWKANKPFKVGIKAAFRDYLFEEYAKWVALNPWSYLYLETYRLPIGSPGIDHCILGNTIWFKLIG